VVALLLGLGALAACGDDGESGAGTTTTRPTTTSTTTTTEPEDPWAVPDQIDEAYVQRVLTELYRLDGEAVHLAMGEGLVTEGVIERLRQVFAEPAATVQINALLEDAVVGFPGYRVPTGTAKVRVEQLLYVSEQCVSAVVHLDFSDVLLEPTARPLAYLAVRQVEASPLPWKIEWVESVDGAAEIQAVDDRCAA
jgi:hypothetical protein